jgi:hypothetical protein
MLRHIISVSLAMTACASLIPTKANAVSLTLEPVGTLLRNPGDTIGFVLEVNPNTFGSSGNEIEIRDLAINYDGDELRFLRYIELIADNTRVSTTTTIARFIFDVLSGVKRDGIGDVFATVQYRDDGVDTTFIVSGDSPLDVQPIERGVPEPLTMLGAATALGYGAILKRKSSKKTVS